jgi:hypothetical protein
MMNNGENTVGPAEISVLLVLTQELEFRGTVARFCYAGMVSMRWSLGGCPTRPILGTALSGD